MRITHWAIIAMAGANMAACSAAPPSKPAAPSETSIVIDEQNIRKLEEDFPRALAARDADAAAFRYAPDAIMIMPGGAPLAGKEAVQTMLNAMVKDPALALQTSIDKVFVAESSDAGYTRGAFSLSATDAKTNKATTTTGWYLTIYKKQADGVWKVAEDVITPGPIPPSAFEKTPGQ